MVSKSNLCLATTVLVLSMLGVVGTDGSSNRGSEHQSMSSGGGVGTCDAASGGGGSCSASSAPTAASRNMAKHATCGLEGKCYHSNSLYERGGSGQAYKPNAPISHTVCDEEKSSVYRHNSASWPFNRRSGRKGSAPRLDVTLRLLSCESSGDDCCCVPLDNRVDFDAQSSIVEVWQARPDGTYSSLKRRPKEDECRARVPIGDDGVATFSTVAPGSTGILQGIGPGGWDSFPYGPPAIHLLATVPGHAPLLVDLPALIHPKTLKQRKFMFPDWRGVAWVKSTPKGETLPSIEIDTWNPDTSENRVKVEVSIYLQRDEGAHSTSVEFCPSLMYGHPSSFFLEPIALCAPSMLDFFEI